MPERLSALDAGFLEAEDSDRNASLAIGAVAVLEGPAPDTDTFTSTIDARVHRIPRCTQVLRFHQWDLTAPEWVTDDAFDITRHVRRTAVPQPGDDAALFRVVADVMERRLDRGRPLWECWVIEGLGGGRWALVIKVHHSVADGISAGAMLASLCDDDHSGPDAADSSETPKVVSRFRLTGLNPISLATDAWHTSVGTAQTALRILGGATEIAWGIVSPAPQDMTGPLTDRRRFSAARVSLTDVTAVCKRFDVTINDVALAAITDSVRQALMRRDQQIRPNSLRTLVPVSIRKPTDPHTPDNQVSVMLPLLPVDQDDPLQRLQTVHRRLTRSKSGGQAKAGSIAVTASNLIPFPVTAWAVRQLTRLPQRGIVTVATNVPGPRNRIRVMGREVLFLLPLPPIAVHLRLGIAITSYADELAFGVLGDFDASVTAEEIAGGIEDGIKRLVTVTRACTKARQMRNQLLLLSS